MSVIRERIESLRAVMAQWEVDCYIVPTADFHQSEMVGDYFRAREYITGFTGSAGTAVICRNEAFLWTDGRYFIQAEHELEGSGITLMKMYEPGVPTLNEWLAARLQIEQTVALDGRTISAIDGKEIQEICDDCEARLIYTEDLIDSIWKDRPALSAKTAFYLDERYSGESTALKLRRIRTAMHNASADCHIVSALDDIAWILNIRGDDIKCSPLLLSYLIIAKKAAYLYVDETKISETIKLRLAENNVSIRPYNDIYEDVSRIKPGITVMIDSDRTNYTLYKTIPDGCFVVDADNPSILMKAVKNHVEIENIRKAHIMDGVAVTKFIYWLKNNIGRINISEKTAADKFHELRAASGSFIEESFESICAYGKHAAIIHYRSTPESDVELKEGAMLLTDTGGHYYEGTTDISRTIILGNIDEEQKHKFTLVLKAHIGLATAKFMHGCCGYNLDILARKQLWEEGIDYNHGTGHGVGYLTNVHEGPAGIRWRRTDGDYALEDGMIITDEPGIYEEGRFGIRTENVLLVRKSDIAADRQFMEFEPLTLAPIDIDGIIAEELTEEEKHWLNDYHRRVRNTISPYLTEDEAEWLKRYTDEI